jgi:hypothetical protein
MIEQTYNDGEVTYDPTSFDSTMIYDQILICPNLSESVATCDWTARH